jgi:hypothetical protein
MLAWVSGLYSTFEETNKDMERISLAMVPHIYLAELL